MPDMQPPKLAHRDMGEGFTHHDGDAAIADLLEQLRERDDG